MVRPGITIGETGRWQSLLAYTFLFSRPTATGSFGPSPFVSRQQEHRALQQQIFTHRLFGQEPHVITLEQPDLAPRIRIP